ncbi:MAG: Gfo/Idh/MocA family oxidoreductase [Lentisphaeria bacterium]|nr:Gfo/Idh/MocA family oxidoreductase [Lentisphaeria bacterium]MDY0176606.1 Gfo/Idh/MocA family oxidoreductase [Lentisphaeria bacterium]NLZ60073.1 Gfo/Idh/MocA family oxidoreductase [Lentisphaerota bacterium]
MKKKIGFIDLFIDEWHANNYPRWISQSSLGSEFELAYAWEEQSQPGGRPLQQWCADMGVEPSASLEELIAKSDCICVLAPSNPESHERLSDLALRSGKPVYIDKPFAPDFAAARRMQKLAEEHRTPLMSCSALRYSSELMALNKLPGQVRHFVCTGGGSNFPEYAIHQIEMVVAGMGCGIEAVTVHGLPERLSALLHYEDQRLASIAYNPAFAFSFSAEGKEQSLLNQGCSKFFENLTENILQFFNSSRSPIDWRQTAEIAACLQALSKGMHRPAERIALQKACS